MIRFVLILLISGTSIKTQAQVNLIRTICGKWGGADSGAYCCDGGPAINARLNYTWAIWLDRFDNIYLADGFNQRVRKIESSTKIITTIAGTGTGGYSGDNGPATDAELFIPSAVIVDTNGNVYISDAENMVIRKVDGTTNIITTFAGTGVSGSLGDGGPATDAQLNAPAGLCFDKVGNIIFADAHNSKIRKIDISTGIITTIAGTGAFGYTGDNGPATHAILNEPYLVFTDSADNIIFSDGGNNVVRKVDHQTGIIRTIAGNGTAGYAGDNGPAVDAEFYYASGIYIDKQQNIYVADQGNGEVRKIDAQTGIITAVVGTGIVGQSGDGGPAIAAQVIPSDIFFDSYGSMFIADQNCIREVYNPLGVHNVPAGKYADVQVYPNPAMGSCTVHGAKGSQVVVYDLLGRTMKRIDCKQENETLDVSGLQSGMYIVTIMDSASGISEIRKIVKE